MRPKEWGRPLPIRSIALSVIRQNGSDLRTATDEQILTLCQSLKNELYPLLSEFRDDPGATHGRFGEYEVDPPVEGYNEQA